MDVLILGKTIGRVNISFKEGWIELLYRLTSLIDSSAPSPLSLRLVLITSLFLCQFLLSWIGGTCSLKGRLC